MAVLLSNENFDQNYLNPSTSSTVVTKENSTATLAGYFKVTLQRFHC
jgi:hypothetical protein